MTKGTWGLVLVVLIIILAGWYYRYSRGENSGGQESATTTAQSGVDAQSSALPSGSAVTNAALEGDLGAVDAQMGAFASDNESIEQGFSDTPVSQESL